MVLALYFRTLHGHLLFAILLDVQMKEIFNCVSEIRFLAKRYNRVLHLQRTLFIELTVDDRPLPRKSAHIGPFAVPNPTPASR